MGMKAAQRFLEALWGDPPPGLIQVWQLDGRRSYYARAVAGAAYYLADHVDAYIGVGLAHRDLGRHRRARNEQVVAIPGVWLDIDVDGGPENKTGAAPTVDAALDLASAVLPPTLTVSSGYGVHAWHLLPAPWRFADRDDQLAGAKLAAQWSALHRQAAADRGWSIDATHDLARLLRAPGSFNGKGNDPAPVELIDGDGPRHQLDALTGAAAAAGDVPTSLDRDADPAGELPVVDIDAARTLDPAVLDALIANSDEFRQTWLHARRGNWSMSEYDLALCSLAADALNDQQLAGLIAMHRRAWSDGGDDPKARRLDYIRRTVAKARQRSERAADRDYFAQLARNARGAAA